MNVIELNNVSVDFAIYGAGSRSFKKSLLNIGTGNRISRDARERVTIHALRELSLTISEGERVGLTGVNGAGKSTLLRTIAGIYEPTSGHIRVNGSVTTLFSLNVGIEPEATGYENIVLRGLAAGMSREEIECQADSIAEFSELGDYLNLPVHTYSAGMSARLAFSISTAVDPDILLMDEWIGAGDSSFIEKAQSRLDSMVDKARILILATHNPKLISRVCTKVIEIENGRIARMGSTKEVLGGNAVRNGAVANISGHNTAR
jgi:ABC-2 type transport system ATP-binding protein